MDTNSHVVKGTTDKELIKRIEDALEALPEGVKERITFHAMCGSGVSTVYHCTWHQKVFYMVRNQEDAIYRKTGTFNNTPFEDIPSHIIEKTINLIRDSKQSRKTLQESIMDEISTIDINDAGLLGFVIAESIDYYTETGKGVINMFNDNPEHAVLLNEMLCSICGWNINSLKNIMEEKREYYNSL